HAGQHHQAADGRLHGRRAAERQGGGGLIRYEIRQDEPRTASLVNEMAGAPQRKSQRLSVEFFRGFLEGRPDEEHWELIDLPESGLRCKVADLYRGTPLQPRTTSRP